MSYKINYNDLILLVMIEIIFSILFVSSIVKCPTAYSYDLENNQYSINYSLRIFFCTQQQKEIKDELNSHDNTYNNFFENETKRFN